MNDLARALKRAVAVGLSSAILLLSAGLDAYAAAGKAVQVAGGANVSAPQVSQVALRLPSLNASQAVQSHGSLDAAGFSKNAFLGAAAAPLQDLALSAALPGASAQAASASVPLKAAAASAASMLSARATSASVSEEVTAPVPAAGVPVSLEGAADSIEAGPASRVASTSRLGRVLRSAASLFGAKKSDGDVAGVAGKESGGVAPLAASTKNDAQKTSSQESAPLGFAEDAGPPAPPENGDGNGGGGDGKGPGKSWGGLGKGAAAFIGALLVMQIGVEALGSSMPTLVQKSFGDFTIVAQLAIFASIAGIIGRQLGPIFVKKHGLRKVYLGSQVLRLISISALCALLATGTMTLPLMMGMYSLNGLLGGISITAENSIPPALIGQDQKKIEKFWTIEQTLLEIIGVAGPIVTGMVVASSGFLPALIAFPVAFAAAIAIMFFTLRIPQKVEAMRLVDLQKAKAEGKTSVGGAFKEFFKKIGHGAKLVWKNGPLKYSFLAYTAYMALNPFLYSMLAPAYALRTVDNPELATSVGGWLTGLYSLGGLLGGLVMIWESKKLEKKKGTPEAETEALRTSMLKWMKWGTVGLLAIGTLAFPSPTFLGTLTIPALALIPFGIAQVITVIKLKSYFQSKVPQADMADAMGFFGAASLAVSTVGLLALKYLFKASPGFTPFWWIAGAMIPVAILYVWLTRKMKQVSAPENK